MKMPAMIMVWTGDHFLPTLHFARLAESTFTSGEAYKLIVQQERDAQTKARRTLEQNNKMWALLSEIAEQVEHCGRHYSSDQWKTLLMHAMGQEVLFLPALDGKTFVPYGGRSSHMTTAQMSELIEFIYVWGLQHGVQFASDRGVIW